MFVCAFELSRAYFSSRVERSSRIELKCRVYRVFWSFVEHTNNFGGFAHPTQAENLFFNILAIAIVFRVGYRVPYRIAIGTNTSRVVFLLIWCRPAPWGPLPRAVRRARGGGGVRTLQATAAAVGPGAVRADWGGMALGREGGHIYYIQVWLFNT